MTGPGHRGWAVAVVVPARDEAERIGRCIASIRHSLVIAAVARSVIVVVADRCQDGTAAAARRALGPSGPVLEVEDGRVGAARRRGTAHGLDLLAAQGPLDVRTTWIMATDADTTVPSDWVTEHLNHGATGATAVAGVVEVDSFEDHAPGTALRFDHGYRVWGPDGEHSHRHGANLGVRADAYHSVGGWQTLATGEDGAFWALLVAAGWPVVATASSQVRTSGRSAGRAPAGFAADLRVLGAAPRHPVPYRSARGDGPLTVKQ